MPAGSWSVPLPFFGLPFSSLAPPAFAGRQPCRHSDGARRRGGVWRQGLRRRAAEENSVRAPNLPASGSAKEPAMIVGALCGAGAALCWAAGFVAVRRGLDHGLLPADIAFHRFVWMGLLLLPVMARSGFKDLGGVGWGRGLIIFALAGPIQAVVSYTGFTL